MKGRRAVSDGGATIPSSGGSREERLARLMADYSDHLNAGEPLDPEQIISEHPDLAQELKAALSALATVDSSVDPVLPQANLGDFRLIREVGRGGMGVVYEAWQNSMDRRVALKVLPFALLSNPKAVARFELEAKVGGRLEHPSIVSVYGKGIEGGAPYYAMEFVEGETLEEILRRLRPSPLESGGGPWKPLESFSRFLKTRDGGTPTAAVESPSRSPVHARQPGPREESRFDSEVIDLKYCLNVAEVFAEVADGLQYAHQRGVIHRDLKPQNLILDRKGKLRILDFGLARLEGHEGLTVSGEFLGTPLYMSPEQAMAHRVPLDHRTDIYSLGATLYEVLTRRPPFRGKDYKETLSQIITRDPPLPRRLNGRIPKGLETITLKCLRKDPGGRYGTAEALAQDLRRFVRGDPIEARPQAVVERVARRAWRNRWPAAVVLGAALLLLTSGLVIRQRSAEARIRKEDLYSQGVLAAVMKIQLGRPAVRPDPRINEGEPRKGPAGARELELLDLAWPDPVEEAVQELERVAALFPRRPDGFYHRARGLWLLGRGPNALEEVDRALASDPGFVPALVLKSVIQ
jgi:serine/threonine protein kinase